MRLQHRNLGEDLLEDSFNGTKRRAHEIFSANSRFRAIPDYDERPSSMLAEIDGIAKSREPTQNFIFYLDQTEWRTESPP